MGKASVGGHGVWGGRETGEGTVTGFVPWLWPSDAFPASVPSTADSLEVQLTAAWRKGRTEGQDREGQRDGGQLDSSPVLSLRLSHSGLLSGLWNWPVWSPPSYNPLEGR